MRLRSAVHVPKLLARRLPHLRDHLDGAPLQRPLQTPSPRALLIHLPRKPEGAESHPPPFLLAPSSRDLDRPPSSLVPRLQVRNIVPQRSNLLRTTIPPPRPRNHGINLLPPNHGWRDPHKD